MREACKTVRAAARDLDLTKTALLEWVRRAQADRTKGRTSLTTAERDELARLRIQNRHLRTGRDILKPRPSSRSTSLKVRLDRRGEGRVGRRLVLSGAARVAQWLLCGAGPAAVRAGPTRSVVARPVARRAYGEPRALRSAARMARPARGGRACQPGPSPCFLRGRYRVAST